MGRSEALSDLNIQNIPIWVKRANCGTEIQWGLKSLKGHWSLGTATTGQVHSSKSAQLWDCRKVGQIQEPRSLNCLCPGIQIVKPRNDGKKLQLARQLPVDPNDRKSVHYYGLCTGKDYGIESTDLCFLSPVP